MRCCEVGRSRVVRAPNVHDRLHRSDLQRVLRSRGSRPYASSMPRAVLLALISALCLLAAGCGGSPASGGDDPAGAVPANAAFYAEATVRPEGDLRDDALAAAGKVLRTDDPQAKIDELMAKAFAESEDPKLDYKKDVASWLGEKVAIWGAADAGSEEDFRGAVVATVEDEDEASRRWTARSRAARRPSARARTRTSTTRRRPRVPSASSRASRCSAPSPSSRRPSTRSRATGWTPTTASRRRWTASRTTGSAASTSTSRR